MYPDYSFCNTKIIFLSWSTLPLATNPYPLLNYWWMYVSIRFVYCRIMHVEPLWILWIMLMAAGPLYVAEGFCCNPLQQRSPRWTIQLWLSTKGLWTARLTCPFPRPWNPLLLCGHGPYCRFNLRNDRVLPLQSVLFITMWRTCRHHHRQRLVFIPQYSLFIPFWCFILVSFFHDVSFWCPYFSSRPPKMIDLLILSSRSSSSLCRPPRSRSVRPLQLHSAV